MTCLGVKQQTNGEMCPFLTKLVCGLKIKVRGRDTIQGRVVKIYPFGIFYYFAKFRSSTFQKHIDFLGPFLSPLYPGLLKGLPSKKTSAKTS